jgi:hypothetical protein
LQAAEYGVAMQPGAGQQLSPERQAWHLLDPRHPTVGYALNLIFASARPNGERTWRSSRSIVRNAPRHVTNLMKGEK